VALTGPGGSGKTRLALQVAGRALEDSPAGAWFVDLAPLADGALVPRAVLAALGVRARPGQAHLATLTAHLRDRPLLLVLDNCEHLLEACAGLVEDLLRACPRLRVLATSRAPLGVPGEAPYRVPPLDVPAAGAPPAAVIRYSAARLFAERAALVRPGFAVTERTAPAVAEVCRRLDGLPLALEPAAAQVRVLSVEALAARLHDRFRLLTGGGRTAPPRQQTLRAALDWSHDLLTAAERRLLRRLAVFAGGWALEAAARPPASVLCRGDVLHQLTHLVDASLVVAEEEPAGEVRYRLLETVREYARERLEAGGEAPRVRARHADYYVALAEHAERELEGRPWPCCCSSRATRRPSTSSGTASWRCCATPTSAPGWRTSRRCWRRRSRSSSGTIARCR
jgi:predicted ATPase